METIELIVHDEDEDDECNDDDYYVVAHREDAYVDDDDDDDGHHVDRIKSKERQLMAIRASEPSLPPASSSSALASSANHENLAVPTAANYNDSLNLTNSNYSSISSIISARTVVGQQPQQGHEMLSDYSQGTRRPSCEITHNSPRAQRGQSQQKQAVSSPNLLASPLQRLAANTGNCNTTSTSISSNIERCNSGSYLGRRSSMTTPDSGVSSQAYSAGGSYSHNTNLSSQRSSSPIVKSIGIGTTSRLYCDKSVNSSPVRVVSTMTSPISEMASSSLDHHALSREHALKLEIEQLQERLKDTEERLESFRIQHDTVSQLHRKLRESNTQLQEESEMLKLDVQHLNECANVLRTELQAARNDRDEAMELQKVLQNELEETRAERKRALEMKEKDVKTIQDLQRQCREMERILMRKHPDSVSALIGKFLGIQ